MPGLKIKSDFQCLVFLKVYEILIGKKPAIFFVVELLLSHEEIAHK